jgi:hypothetical protein
MSSNAPDNNILRTLRTQQGDNNFQPVNYNNESEDNKAIWFTPMNICFMLMTIISLALIAILIMVYK